MPALYIPPETRPIAEILAGYRRIDRLMRGGPRAAVKTQCDLHRADLIAVYGSKTPAEVDFEDRCENLAAVEISAPVRVRRIILEVARETGISTKLILGDRRKAEIVAARFAAIKRVADETGWSLPRIGVVFNRDHTSILHCLRKMGAKS